MNQYDDHFADNLSQPAPGEKPKRGWFKRNWLWFIPTVVLVPLLCCCGGPIGLFWAALSALFNLPPYQDTIALAEQNAIVQQEIGTPLDAPDGFMDLVEISGQGGIFEADETYLYAEVPISGSNGTGWLYIDATTSDGGLTWTYTTREIHIDSTGDVVDLLNPGNTSSGSEADDASNENADTAIRAIERSLEERGLTIPDQE